MVGMQGVGDSDWVMDNGAVGNGAVVMRAALRCSRRTLSCSCNTSRWRRSVSFLADSLFFLSILSCHHWSLLSVIWMSDPVNGTKIATIVLPVAPTSHK